MNFPLKCYHPFTCFEDFFSSLLTHLYKTESKYFPLGSQRPDPATTPHVRHPSEASRPLSVLSSKLTTLSALTKAQEEFVSKTVTLKY